MDKLHYFRPDWIASSNEIIEADLCVYGGTAAGVIAAKTAAERGLRVVLLHPGHTLGGMTTGGLGWTDYGKQSVIGGAARQFYRDLGAFYGRDEEWLFEPHAAQEVMNGYADALETRCYQYLGAVEMSDENIVSATMLGGLRVRAKMWMDATYEGDLMALAGVSTHVGRESNRIYGETINGVQVRDKHQFSHAVDPYVVPGQVESGTLPGINASDSAPQGSGDGRIQAYNFRVCMTDDPALKIDWEKPDGYEPSLYELGRRWFRGESDSYNAQLSGWSGEPLQIPRKFDVLTPRTAGGFHKTDTNNHGPFSSDYIGANYAWPEADYSMRETIFAAHVRYQQGLYWFMANDAGVPPRYREAYAKFGLARDEWRETAHWPHQLYVREARRLIGDYVMTEHDAQGARVCEDAVGMGSYALDSHNCQRIVRAGHVLNEGDVQLQPRGPYGISYRSIVPRRSECRNLLMPVCVSSSHIAFGSIRMEPVFMVLAQSAAIAADLCLRNRCAVQQLPYGELAPELRAAGQVTAPLS